MATALVIAGGAESTFGSGYNSYAGLYLLTFGGASGMAAAFGFPGTASPLGSFPNSHGGTFSGVIVSLT